MSRKNTEYLKKMDDINKALIAELKDINNHLSKISNALSSIATGIGRDTENITKPYTHNLTESLSKIAYGIGTSQDPESWEKPSGELVSVLNKLTEVIEKNSSK